ncbi:MAG: ATP-binding protein [Magnetovibrionaceae bacterium]
MTSGAQEYASSPTEDALRAEVADLRQRVNDLARLVSDWVWETDPEGKLTSISQRVVEHLGIHPLYLTGKAFSDFGFFPKGGFPKHHSAFRDLPFEAVETGGRTRTYRLSGLPQFDTVTGAFLGFRGTAKDVTEESVAIRKAKEAQEAAGRANQAKSDFLAHMSHELRTPLNAIIGFSDAIMAHIFGPIGSPRYLEYVEHIQQSGHHLLDLVNDVLDLSKVEAGAMVFRSERLGCAEVIDEVLSLVSVVASEARVAVEIAVEDDDLAVEGDHLRLRQVLLNLLSNAIKFTTAGEKIVMAAADVGGGMVEFSVSDQGVGMSVADVEQAMDRFGQVECSIAKPGQGTGLGLPLSKAMVEAMGGRFGIESEQGVGTRVWLRLPIFRNRRG